MNYHDTGTWYHQYHDGDGQRVKGTVNGTVTAYAGNWFEWSGSTSTMKKYYYAGAQRIAMRTGSGTGTSSLQWIIGDHLGSTTKITDVDGSINSQRRYRPWGEARFGGALPPTFAFTGQRQEDLLGGVDVLYYYGARWYDAALGRWLSPDSIIPEAAQGVHAWSRYTYVNNAPTRYQDPKAHSVDDGPPYRPTPTPRYPTPYLWSKPLTPTPPVQIGPGPIPTPTPRPTPVTPPIDYEETFDFLTKPDLHPEKWTDALPGPFYVTNPRTGTPYLVNLREVGEVIDGMLATAYVVKTFVKGVYEFLRDDPLSELPQRGCTPSPFIPDPSRLPTPAYQTPPGLPTVTPQ